MNILALETSSEACSVAVSCSGVYLSRFEIAPQQHAKLLMPMIEKVMADAGLQPKELTGLAYGHGPGSFTGVRIAAGTIQGIALGLNLKVVGISTLQALAHRAWREFGHEKVVAAIDARMQEVYAGAYETQRSGVTNTVLSDVVGVPDSVELPAENHWVGVGSGWCACEAALQKRCSQTFLEIQPELLPHALDVLILAEEKFRSNQAVPAEAALPVYLRDKVALTEQERAVIKTARNQSNNEL